MTQQDSNPDPVGSVSKRDYLRLLLAAMGIGALSTGSVETAKAAHLSDSPYPNGAWGYSPIAGNGVSERPSIAEINKAWSETYHHLFQDVDVGARYYAEKNDPEWDLLPIVWDSLNAPAKEDMPAGSMKIEDNNSDSFRLVSIDDDGSHFREATVTWSELPLGTTEVSWETAADWDAAQSETGVHHEQPAGTDWASASTLEKGWPGSNWSNWSVPTPDLYAPLHEDTGSTSNDVSGNGFDGTINGATTGANGLLGHTAYDFDGTDDFVDYGEPAALDYQSDDAFSIAGWINLDNFTEDNSILSNRQGSAFILFAANSSSEAVMLVQDNGGSSSAVGDTKLSTDTWAFIVGTFNPVSASQHDTVVYIDGSQDGTGTGDLFSSSNITNDGWTAGRNDNVSDGFDDPTDGTLSDVALWSSVLSSTDVSELYAAFTGESDHWTSKKTAVGISSTITVTTTTTIPTNTQIDVTLFEDVDNDDTGSGTDALGNNYDNSQTKTLTGGGDQTVDMNGFDGGSSTNAYWFHIELDITNNDPTTTSPTMSSISIDV